MMDCNKPGIDCDAGSARYKQVLEFHMIALPSGIRAHQVIAWYLSDFNCHNDHDDARSDDV